MTDDIRTMRRIIASGAALSLTLGLVLWWTLSSIEDTTYFALTDELEVVGDWLLWASAIGQTGFVITWVTLPWWTHWVGRALMIKSLALMVYLDIALVLQFVNPFPALQMLLVILFSFIVLGIWTQFGTLMWERRKRSNPRHDLYEEEPPYVNDH